MISGGLLVQNLLTSLLSNPFAEASAAVYTCVFHALMAPYLTVDVILHQANGPLIFLKYVCLCVLISH